MSAAKVRSLKCRKGARRTATGRSCFPALASRPRVSQPSFIRSTVCALRTAAMLSNGKARCFTVRTQHKAISPKSVIERHVTGSLTRVAESLPECFRKRHQRHALTSIEQICVTQVVARQASITPTTANAKSSLAGEGSSRQITFAGRHLDTLRNTKTHSALSSICSLVRSISRQTRAA